MTLTQMLASLSTEKLVEIQTAIVEAGISNELKGDYKALFKNLMRKSSGKQKKIYSALAKASHDEMCRMSDAIVKLPLL